MRVLHCLGLARGYLGSIPLPLCVPAYGVPGGAGVALVLHITSKDSLIEILGLLGGIPYLGRSSICYIRMVHTVPWVLQWYTSGDTIPFLVLDTEYLYIIVIYFTLVGLTRTSFYAIIRA